MDHQDIRDSVTDSILKELNRSGADEGGQPSYIHIGTIAKRRAEAQRYADAAIEGMGGIAGITTYYMTLIEQIERQLTDVTAELKDIVASLGDGEVGEAPEIRVVSMNYDMVSPWDRKYNRKETKI